MDANTELVCVMASLGYNDDDDYYMGDDCIESLRDCMRFLKKEDENCNIRRQMGAANLLQKDLLPMLIHLGDNEELIDIVIRLLVNLTSPADICFNKLGNDDEAIEEGAKKKKMINTYLTKYNEVITHLQKYKKEFTNEKALAAVGAQLGRILRIDVEDRTEDDLLFFERLLLLLRNILHVPSSPEDELRTDDDASLHDQVLWSLHINGIDDLIIYVSSTPEEARWSMHIMEIINLMFREQNPETLAKSSKEKSEKEKAEIARDMLLAKNREEAMHKASRKNVASSRHSRFGGTFWVKNMKGVGNTNTLVHHKLVNDPNDITFDEKKYPNRVAKRNRPLKDNDIEKRSTLKIRLFLKEFCKKFLEHSYNPMMRQVKDSVLAKRTQENDDTYYIWGMRFFMMFNRAHAFKVEYVSETISLNAFHYILKQINNYYDQFLMNKRGGWEPWAIRLHKAIQTYKELLTYIAHMDQSNDERLQDAASVIKNNVFYHEEYRTIFLVLLRHYQVGRHTRKYLVDLIETFHLFLKLLERFCKNKGSLLIKKKQKVTKKRKKTTGASASSRNVMSAEQLEELWENDLAPSLSGVLQGYEDVSQDVLSPFDYESDVPVDEQRFNAKIRIQDLLRKGETGEAVALLRLSRECWPEEEDFGSDNMSPEDEFALYRNLLTMELERPAFAEPEEEENEIEDEEEEAVSVRSVEREFHLNSFLQSLVSPHIMLPYMIQLKQFQTNSPTTNHAIVKMMHRVAVDLKFPEIFFQLSIFIVFKEAVSLKLTEHKELNKFASYIIYKFTETAVANPSIYVELLFLKTTGDCVQISGREPIRTAAAKAKWTTDEEIELKTLYDQHKEDEDVVGEIMKNMKEPRSRKKIINKLVDLQCVESPTDLPNPEKSSGTTGSWTFEQEEELKALFEEYQNAEDVVGEILKKISNQDLTRRKITNKLVRLRLVNNAKELPKPPRPSKAYVWSDEQTEELHRLYDEYKQTEDVLLNILTTMTFKKSKNAIVRQLLETGKIDEESALCRRKQKKSGGSKKAFKAMLYQNDEPIYDDWSDEEPKSPSDRSTNGDEESGSSKSKLKQMKQMSEKKKNRRFGSDDSESESDISSSSDSEDEENVTSSSAPLPELVLTAREDFPEQIVWLQTRLRRAAEDREEDDDWYAMPLLTISEGDHTAMQDKSFKQLLVALGIRPPVDEQEMFWRIDENLSPEKLRQLADLLDKTGDDLKSSCMNEKATSKTSKKEKKETTSEEKKRSSKREDDEAIARKKKLALKALMAKRKNRRFALSEDESDTSNSDNEDKTKSSSEPSKVEEKTSSTHQSSKRRRIMLDNEDEDETNLENDDADENNEIEEKNPKRRRVMDDDDDDNYSDEDDGDNDQENKNMGKAIKTNIKTKRILDDDESSDDDGVETMETQDIDDSVPLHKLMGDPTQTNLQTQDIDDSVPLHKLMGDPTQTNLQTQDIDDSVPLQKLLGESVPSQKLSSLQTQDVDDSVPLHELARTQSEEKAGDTMSQPILRDTTNIVT